MTFAKFPTSQIDAAATWVQQHAPEADICVTGGKGAQWQTYFSRNIPALVEFDATCKGVQYLLQKTDASPSTFVLTNVGTGTSIHFVDKEKHHRMGGTGVGGGTLIGLSSLLAGVTDYDEIVRLARVGNRERVDLKVSHIYEGATPPIPGDLTASNFGHVSRYATSPDISDMLASVIGMVGETVSTVSVFAAGQAETAAVVYIGSSFVNNDVLRQIVERYTRLRGAEPVFLEHGEYSGAIGALLSV